MSHCSNDLNRYKTQSFIIAYGWFFKRQVPPLTVPSAHMSFLVSCILLILYRENLNKTHTQCLFGWYGKILHLLELIAFSSFLYFYMWTINIFPFKAGLKLGPAQTPQCRSYRFMPPLLVLDKILLKNFFPFPLPSPPPSSFTVLCRQHLTLVAYGSLVCVK